VPRTCHISKQRDVTEISAENREKEWKPIPDLEKNIHLHSILKFNEWTVVEEAIFELHDGPHTMKYLIVNYEVIFFHQEKIRNTVKAPMILNSASIEI
jgi:hypothetical protein